MREIKYIAYSILFAFVWFFVILPFLLKKMEGSSPYLQFIIFNVGLIIFFQIFLKTHALSSIFDLKTAIGLTLIILGGDIFMPDYHVNLEGQLLTGALLGPSSADYIAGTIAIQLGLKGIFIFGFTYIVVPFLLFYLSYLLLSKEFLTHV